MVNPTTQSSLNVASKDKFLLVLTLPYILKKIGKTDPIFDIDKLQISFFGTVVPNISVPSIEARYGGQSLNFSSHSRPNYPPLTVNIVVDNEFKNYYLLWKWLSLLNDPEESTYTGTPQNLITQNQLIEMGSNNEYQTNLSILGLNEYGQTAIEFTYTNAFITDIGGINYSDRESSIIETEVKFQYNQFLVSKPQTLL